MTTPTQRIIAATEAALDQLDTSLAAWIAKTAGPDFCGWCGGPCLCHTYSPEWDDDLALALAEADAAVIADAPADWAAAQRRHEADFHGPCDCGAPSDGTITYPDGATFRVCRRCYGPEAAAADAGKVPWHYLSDDTPPQPAPPPAAAVQSADDPLPAIARLWGRLERGEISQDRYVELLREGGWL